MVVGFLLLGASLGFSLNQISRDPLASAGEHPLLGVQSEVGVLIWWSAASISLATWAVIRHLGAERTMARFFFWSGVITAILALDDQFQFHDHMASEWFGLRERYVFVSLAIMIGAWALAFREIIWRSEKTLLVLAFVFGALSVVGDFISQQNLEDGAPAGPAEVLNYLEDTMKLLAIVSWCAYLIRFGIAELRSSNREPHTGSAPG